MSEQVEEINPNIIFLLSMPVCWPVLYNFYLVHNAWLEKKHEMEHLDAERDSRRWKYVTVPEA